MVRSRLCLIRSFSTFVWLGIKLSPNYLTNERCSTIRVCIFGGLDVFPVESRGSRFSDIDISTTGETR